MLEKVRLAFAVAARLLQAPPLTGTVHKFQLAQPGLSASNAGWWACDARCGARSS